MPAVKTGITHSPGGEALEDLQPCTLGVSVEITHAKNFKACFGVCFRAHAAVVICPTCRCGCLNRHRAPMSLTHGKPAYWQTGMNRRIACVEYMGCQ